MVTLGIPPTRPETGFGYLKQGTEIQWFSRDLPCRTVCRKTRCISTAKKYLERGTYFWNCGVFVWKASTLSRGIAEACARYSFET